VSAPPKDLRGHLRDVYNKDLLRPELRDRFQGLASAPLAEEAPPEERRAPPRGRGRLGLAAALLMGLVGGGAYRHFQAPASPARVFAEELAAHHHKRFAVEFPAADMATLRARMHQLGFTLVAPALLRGDGVHLIGGRYCSFRGRTVAQLRLEGPGGETWTLFETPLAEDFHEDVRGEFEVSGLQVTVWCEGGLLLGWTKPKP